MGSSRSTLSVRRQACSLGTVKAAGTSDRREQQILFRPGMSGAGVAEPHLFIEPYTGEGTEGCNADAKKTQVLANPYIRVRPIGKCSDAATELHSGPVSYLGGEPTGDYYFVNCYYDYVYDGDDDYHCDGNDYYYYYYE